MYPNATFGEMGRLLCDGYRMMTQEQLKIFINLHNNYDVAKTFEENIGTILKMFSPPTPSIRPFNRPFNNHTDISELNMESKLG